MFPVPTACSSISSAPPDLDRTGLASRGPRFCRDRLLRRSADSPNKYRKINIMHKLLPARKSIGLSSLNYLGERFYFITICCHRKRPVFNDSVNCQWLIRILSEESAACHFTIHAYCIMPDHVHFLAQGLSPRSDLLHFVKTLKLKTSRAYFESTAQKLWQRRFFDHILRRNETVEAVTWYIWLNPVRAGLVPSARKYPYSGSFSDMEMPSVWSNAAFQPTWKRPGSSRSSGPPQKAAPTKRDPINN